MKLNLYYGKKIYSSIIHSPTSIRDVIINLKNFTKSHSSKLIALSSKNELLAETHLIVPKTQGEQSDIYILPRPNQLITEEKTTPSMSIEEMLMKATGAEERLKIKGRGNHRSADILSELIRRDDEGIGNLLNLIQGFDVRDNRPVQPDEEHVRQLKEMGFPENRARNALIRARNDVGRATDILLRMDDIEGEDSIDNFLGEEES